MQKIIIAITALAIAFSSSPLTARTSAITGDQIIEAMHMNNIPLLTSWLDAKKLDVNKQYKTKKMGSFASFNGLRPLDMAAQLGNPAIVQLLLSRGAQPNLQSGLHKLDALAYTMALTYVDFNATIDPAYAVPFANYRLIYDMLLNAGANTEKAMWQMDALRSSVSATLRDHRIIQKYIDATNILAHDQWERAATIIERQENIHQ